MYKGRASSVLRSLEELAAPVEVLDRGVELAGVEVDVAESIVVGSHPLEVAQTFTNPKRLGEAGERLARIAETAFDRTELLESARANRSRGGARGELPWQRSVRAC